MNLEAKALDFEILWRDAVLTFAGLVVIILDNLWNSCSRTVKMLARRGEQRHDLVLTQGSMQLRGSLMLLHLLVHV